MMEKTRRRVLAGIGVATSSVLAGCSGDDSGGSSSGPTVPEWAGWIPANDIGDETEISSLNIDKAREELPREELVELGIPDIAEAYGTEERNITHFISYGPTNGVTTTITTGDFDAEQVKSGPIESTLTKVETHGDFVVYDRNTTSDRIAIGDSAVITGDEPRHVIDTHNGDEPAVGDQDADLELLLSRTVSATSAFISLPVESFKLIPSAEKPKMLGGAIDVADGEGLRVEIDLLYNSSTAAETALEEHRDEISELMTGDADTVETIEQDEDIIHMVLKRDEFDFDI